MIKKLNTRVKKAVIPAAGMGTRFFPVTRGLAKEMIPIVDTPMIQFVIEEAVRAGITDIILITSKHKEAIENYFDYNYEFDCFLEEKKKTELLRLSREIGGMCHLVSIHQKNPLGLGHAVLCASAAVGNEPFAVLLGDDIIDSEVPCIEQLIQVYEKHSKSVVGLIEVPKTEVNKYGIVSARPLSTHADESSSLWQINGLIEKPSADEAPSCLAIPGRYVLSPEIFDCLRATPAGRGGEIQLTDGLERLLLTQGILGYQFEGKRYDTGDRLSWIYTTLSFALKRPDLGPEIVKMMQELLKEQKSLSS